MSLLKDFDTVSKDMVDLQRYSVALEGFKRLMEGRDEIDGDAAYAMRVSLESIDPAFSIKDSSVITLRAIKEGLIAAAKAAREMIRYVFELINSFYVKFTGSLGKVRGMQAGVNKRLAKMGSRTTHSKMSISGVQRLSVDGKFQGDAAEALQNVKEMTTYILEIYPKAVAQIGRDFSREAVNICKSDEGLDRNEASPLVAAAFGKILLKDFVAPKGSQALKGELANGSGDGGKMFTSVVLPGNMAFVYVSPQDVAAALTQGMDANTAISSVLKMTFTELSLGGADTTEREVEVPSIDDIRQLNDMIAAIITLGEKAAAGQKDYQTVKVVVDDAIGQIAALDDQQDNSSNKVLHMLGEVSKKLAEPVGKYTHWLAVTLSVWVTYLNHALNHYEKEAGM